jgi:D-glycero-D-manno-heptose 1,7-bisphosphate phosphatase
MISSADQPVRRAVFLDRDGTLNKEVGFLTEIERFQLFPYTGSAVARINQAGLLAVVITNQSGIARGLLTTELVEETNERMTCEIMAAGGRIDQIYYCPHHPQGSVPPYNIHCDCRKPATGLLARAAEELGIELTASFVVGDRYVDVGAAHGVGARGVLVKTGFGRGEWINSQHGNRPQPHHVADNLEMAVEWILNQVQAQTDLAQGD